MTKGFNSLLPSNICLPLLAPEIETVLNYLAAKSWVLPFTENIEEATFQPIFCFSFAPWNQKPAGPYVALSFTTYAGRFSLFSSTIAADYLCDLMLPDWRNEDPSLLPIEWRVILAIEIWLKQAGFINHIYALDAKIVTTLPVNKHGGGMLEVAIQLHGEVFAGLLLLEEIVNDHLFILNYIAPSASLNHFCPRFTMRIGLPAMTLRMRDVSDLKVEDVILGSGLTAAAFEAVVNIDGYGGFAARIEENGRITIVDELWRHDAMNISDDENNPEFEQEYNTPTAFALSHADDFDALPVKIDVVLASAMISLDELRALGPGATLPLEADLSAPLVIRANGQPMAKGCLVRINDRIAVQITTWPGIKPDMIEEG